MMKRIFLTAVALLLLPLGAFAMPNAFEIGYVNYAWGYNARGCFVDANRFVYTYRFGTSSTGKPIQQIGQVSEQEFQQAQALLEKARSGTYSETHVGVDGGTTHWTGTVYGDEVKLQAKGDMAGVNSAPEAQDLVALLNKWCGR